ncbi:MAG: hypothetical protein ACTSVI_12965 [Promethearchaeota archaeon]
MKEKLSEIEQTYNQYLELLNQIVEEKQDDAAEDPQYIQLYTEATALNEQYELLQEKILNIENSMAGLEEQAAMIDGEQNNLSSPEDSSAGFAMEAISGDVPSAGQLGSESSIDMAGEDIISTSAASKAEESLISPREGVTETTSLGTPSPNGNEVASIAPEGIVEEKPLAPKYVKVERTRIEEEVIFEREWTFAGFSSQITPALEDLVSKEGYITENILIKQPGKVNLIIPFKLKFPVGLMIEQAIKRFNLKLGLIYYPNDDLDSRAINNVNQIIQQFFGSLSNHDFNLIFTRVKQSLDANSDKLSIIIGGLPEKNRSLKDNLKKAFKNIFFDNDVYYSGQWIDTVKDFTTKLRLNLLSMVSTSTLIQNMENLRKFAESF